MGSTDVWLGALDLLWLHVAASGSPPTLPLHHSPKAGAQAPGWLALVAPSSLWSDLSPPLQTWELQQFEAPSPQRYLSAPPGPPCTSGARDDRLPRCCLCWRHGADARDPETKKDRKGVGRWEKDKERERWVECEGNGKR